MHMTSCWIEVIDWPGPPEKEETENQIYSCICLFGSDLRQQLASYCSYMSQGKTD